MDRRPFSHRRPRWWPENEDWPPKDWRARRIQSHFFRRMGCLFLLFNLFISIIVLTAAGILAKLLGIIQLPGDFPWAVILGAMVVLFGFGLLAWAGRSLRRMSAPLEDLIAAADRVAQGDYAARVEEQGPPEVRSLGHVFNSMASRLQATDEQRRNLLADVTHELRTPLTVIQGNVEGILDGIYEADEAHLKSILEETHLLSRLVDDLRTLALADSGALQLDKEPTDLAVLIGETVADFRLKAEAAGVKLALEMPANAPLLNVDPERIRQVLVNLITNSLRHTPSGGTITLRFEMAGAEQVKIEVEDSGAGIQPEDLPHIFERFYKTNDSQGMGLGLAIAKDLVQAHGGSIQAESQPGEGAKLSIDLPV